jgi:hypothetical protein
MSTQYVRKPPSPEQVIAQQRAESEKRQLANKAAAPPPVVLPPDSRTPIERYVDQISPTTIAGKLIKFAKDGKFVINETEEEIDPSTDFVALCDETLIGWIKFGPDGAPPERQQGLLYDGFVMPSRESLGDLDPNEWPEGPSGQPSDPWQHQMCLVLQSPETRELFTFATSSQTGRRSVGNLLRHYNRMRKTDPGSYPIVRLMPSGFDHRDERVGWVHVPGFAVVGRTPKGGNTAVPETSPPDPNDEILF